MKTNKIIVHADTTQAAQAAIDAYVSEVPCHRVERQGMKTRLYSYTGAPIVEYRAATWQTCICKQCVLRRRATHELAHYNKLHKVKSFRQNGVLHA